MAPGGAARRRPPRTRRIPYDLVARVDTAVHLSVRLELLAPAPLERWLDEHAIGRIPGAGDDERRASDLLGRVAVDPDGRPIGRVVDLVAEDGTDGPRITAAIVVRGPWGRLLGYERDEAAARGCWRRRPAILRRNMTTVPWESLRLESPLTRSGSAS